MTVLEMQGNPCPIPVVEARKELAKNESDGVIVVVDNFTAVQNLEKMAKGVGYSFSYEKENESTFRVTINKNGAAPIQTESQPLPAASPTLSEGATILISKNHMGEGSEELGKILIKGFIFSLTELPVPPKAVIFVNSGVYLSTKGSNTLADLQILADKGTEIRSCGTCLNYYSLTEQLEVGEIADMFAIAGYLNSAQNTITL